ncbi:hypothetical protein L7F22_050651 [Adiantum nelumboides]|nr:hypothetical protein [Adiantum nelumboides]
MLGAAENVWASWAWSEEGCDDDAEEGTEPGSTDLLDWFDSFSFVGMFCMRSCSHLVLEFMQQEGIEEVMIGNAVIMLLLYADDVVLLVHSLEDAQKLMIALENFCLHSGLIVNGSKTKVMLVKTLNKEKPCIVYNKEPLEVVESFKYLGLEVLANHKWKDCAMRRLEAKNKAYYAFENMCNANHK